MASRKPVQAKAGGEEFATISTKRRGSEKRTRFRQGERAEVDPLEGKKIGPNMPHFRGQRRSRHEPDRHRSHEDAH